MAREEAPVPTRLRKPIIGTLEERRSRARLRVDIVALAADTLRFVANRSLPPGTVCTIELRRTPPLEVEVTVESTASVARDLFASSASVRRVRESDRARFETLLQRQRSAPRE